MSTNKQEVQLFHFLTSKSFCLCVRVRVCVCVCVCLSLLGSSRPEKLLNEDEPYHQGLTTSMSSPCLLSSQAQEEGSSSSSAGGLERRRSMERKQSIRRKAALERSVSMEQGAELDQRRARERADSEPEPPTENGREKRYAVRKRLNPSLAQGVAAVGQDR